MANGNGKSLWERVFGIQLRPHERKLLLMKRELVDELRKNPQNLALFKRTVAQLQPKDVQVRIESMPEPCRAALRKMDGSGLPSETRALVNCVVFQMLSILEEIDKVE